MTEDDRRELEMYRQCNFAGCLCGDSDLRLPGRRVTMRGAVVQTLPTPDVFLSVLAGGGDIVDHLFLVMEEGDL